jgi:hypothetical protein
MGARVNFTQQSLPGMRAATKTVLEVGLAVGQMHEIAANLG